MRILVTGGTGTLGRQIVHRLHPTDHEVSVLSRRPSLPTDFPACELRTGDLTTGQGLVAALTDVDAVIHCASNPKDLRAAVDVRGTSNLIAAARAGALPHITYVSIVGCDQIPVPYYKAKQRAENQIEQSGLFWSILRATQFHDFLVQVLSACNRPPVAIIPRAFRFQPVHGGEVAARLIAITTQRAGGRQPDFGGPREADIAEWMRLFQASIASRKRVMEVPVPGRIGRGFRAGRNTVSEGERGTVSFEEYLSAAM